MAGARAIEEILSRGGGERFAVTVFGDEPYGNYNRILLSNVLAGADDAREIYLNPVDWYADNNIELRAGVRVVRIDRFAHLVHADDGTIVRYDKLILATGSRSFFPPMEGMWQDDKTLTPAAFSASAASTTADAMIEFAAGKIEGRGHRRRAARPGGRARACRTAGFDGRCRTGAADPDERPTRRPGRRHPAPIGRGPRHRACTPASGRPEVLTPGRSARRRSSSPTATSVACDMLVVAAGIRPNVGLAQRAGLTVERAIVVDDHMRSVDDDDIYVVGECAQHRGQVYGLVAPLWEQATVLADHITGANPRAAYHGSRMATKLKVAGVDVAAMGLKAPEHDDDEFVQFSEPKHGVYKTVVVRDDKLVGATLVGDVSKVAFLMQAFDRGLPLPPERISLMFDIGTPERRRSAPPNCPTTRRCATATG